MKKHRCLPHHPSPAKQSPSPFTDQQIQTTKSSPHHRSPRKSRATLQKPDPPAGSEPTHTEGTDVGFGGGGAHRGGDELVGVGACGGADHRRAAGGRGSPGAAASEQAGSRGAQLRRRHSHRGLVGWFVGPVRSVFGFTTRGEGGE